MKVFWVALSLALAKVAATHLVDMSAVELLHLIFRELTMVQHLSYSIENGRKDYFPNHNQLQAHRSKSRV